MADPTGAAASPPSVAHAEVVVLGGGPAGAASARLLASWGHTVLLVTRRERHPPLAESLPPSCRKVLAALGAIEAVDGARFFRTSGNTSWWGGAGPRVERFPGPAEGWGYQVVRHQFDRLLLGLADAAGVRVLRDAAAYDVHLPVDRGAARVAYGTPTGAAEWARARFVLDCSGRAGVLARRGWRRPEPGRTTVALTAIWARDRGWPVEDESHTLVESYSDGWAWSVPVSPRVRYFTVMIHPRLTEVTRGTDLRTVYRGELQKTHQFRRLLSSATLESAPWACDASLYTAHRFAGPAFLLVGDAGSFIDPLSSYGVKKALASAWLAATVTHTCLVDEAMAGAALELFDTRERRIYASFLARSTEIFREAGEHHAHPFWDARTRGANGDLADADLDAVRREPDVLEAFEALKRCHAIALRPGPGLRIGPRAAVHGRRVVLEDRIVSLCPPDGLRFLGPIDLVALVEMAPAAQQVPELFDLYTRTIAPVPLTDFLAAVSTLLARRVLTNTAAD